MDKEDDTNDGRFQDLMTFVWVSYPPRFPIEMLGSHYEACGPTFQDIPFGKHGAFCKLGVHLSHPFRVIPRKYFQSGRHQGI